jgi:hypothetical protein
MIFKEITAVYYDNWKKYQHSVCKNEKILILEQVVHIVTTRFEAVNKFAVRYFLIIFVL